MALSSRIHNLRRNPTVSRDTLHGVVSQMMGKKGVTDSVKKTLKKTGHFYGSKKLNRGQFEKAIRDISEHLEKAGVKENRFTRDIKRSLRSNKGFVKGSAAEKIFTKDVKQQMAAGEPTGIDPKIKNRLRTKLMQGEKLTKRDLEGVPEEELERLKGLTEALQSIHRRERAEEIEKEAVEQKKGQTDEDKVHEKTSVSAAAREDKKGPVGQNSGGSSGSKSPSIVPLQGGFGGGINPERKENLERISADIETGLPPKKDLSSKESSERTPVKEESADNGSDSNGLSDMEIG